MLEQSLTRSGPHIARSIPSTAFGQAGDLQLFAPSTSSSVVQSPSLVYTGNVQPQSQRHRPQPLSFNSCPNLPVLSQVEACQGETSTLSADGRSRTPSQNDYASSALSDQADIHQQSSRFQIANSTPRLQAPASHLTPPTIITRSLSESHLSLQGQQIKQNAQAERPRSTRSTRRNSHLLSMTPVTLSPVDLSSLEEERPDTYFPSLLNRSASAASVLSSTDSSISSRSRDSSTSSCYDTSSITTATSPTTHIQRSFSATSLGSSLYSVSSDSGSGVPTPLQIPEASTSYNASSPVSPNGPPSAVSSLLKSSRTRSNAAASTATRKGRAGKLSDLDRKKVCEYAQAHSKQSQDSIGLRFGVERSTVSKILKEKDRWLQMSEEDLESRLTQHRNSLTLAPVTSPANSRQSRPCRFPHVEKPTIEWMKEVLNNGGIVSDIAIRNQALAIAHSLNIPTSLFKASVGWLDRFKQRACFAEGRFYEPIREINSAELPSPATFSTSAQGDDESASVFSTYQEDMDFEQQSEQEASLLAYQNSINDNSPLNTPDDITPFAGYADPSMQVGLAINSAPTTFMSGMPAFSHVQSRDYSRQTPIISSAQAPREIPSLALLQARDPLTPESPTFFIAASQQRQFPYEGNMGPPSSLPSATLRTEGISRRATISAPPSAHYHHINRSDYIPASTHTHHDQYVHQHQQQQQQQQQQQTTSWQLPHVLSSLAVVQTFLREQPQFAPPGSVEVLNALYGNIYKQSSLDHSMELR